MNRISLTVKDDSKVDFLKELINHLDFVEILETKKKKTTKHNFLNSAGIWKDRDISLESIRKMAWKYKI